jgi:hypothetical protein
MLNRFMLNRAFPISSATCERSFGAMKKNKNLAKDIIGS